MAVLCPSGTEAASVHQQQSFAIWHVQDLCGRQSFQKFPDFTPESNRLRDRALRVCEAKNHLPPRDDVHQSPIHRIPDADAE